MSILLTVSILYWFHHFNAVGETETYEVKVILAGAGNQSEHLAQMHDPFGVNFNRKHDMYIVEYKGERFNVLTCDGRFKRLGGNGEKGFKVRRGPASDAMFNGLHNVIVDEQGQVYLSDTFNHLIRKYDPETREISIFSGTVPSGKRNKKGRLPGDFKDGSAEEAKYFHTYCINWWPGKTKMVIADLNNRRVRLLDMKTRIVSTIAGNGKQAIPKNGDLAIESPLLAPRAVVVDRKGQVYIASREGHALRVIRPDGRIYTLVNLAGKKGNKLGDASKAQLSGPKYLDVDQQDRVWIADDQNNRICRFEPETNQLVAIIGQDSLLSNWRIKRPHGVTIHPDGSIYVVDSGNHRILKLTRK